VTPAASQHTRRDSRYDDFGPGFFDRADANRDGLFYAQPRLVTHIDDGAIEAAGRIYQALEIHGTVLDLMSSWISHFAIAPDRLVALGRNALELARNEAAVGGIVADVNDHPELPFVDAAFEHAVCAVSVDYLSRPLDVFDDVARVLRPGGVFCHVFSNRLFPTKAINGWLHASEEDRVTICAEYFRRSGVDGGSFWTEPEATVSRGAGDPLYAVWARRRG
jgi:SAM-dependent methyltransferase